jgi:hypothetical protein
MQLSEVKTWSDLMNFLALEHHNENLKLVSEKIGISPKSFFEIKKGRLVPQKKLQRNIKGHMQQHYNAEIQEISGGVGHIKIKIQELHIITGDRNNQDSNLRSNNLSDYLLTRITKLEEDLQRKDKLIDSLTPKKRTKPK